jgi:hypothetical protein
LIRSTILVPEIDSKKKSAFRCVNRDAARLRGSMMPLIRLVAA